VIVDSIGEIFQEDEEYLVLRNFHCYDPKDSDDSPTEEFTGIVKSTIRKRIDLVVDLDEGVFVGQQHPEEKEDV